MHWIKYSPKVKISPFHIFILGFLSILSKESLLFFYAGAILLYILKTFWRENESKHLLVNMLLYWAVVAILIPYAELTSKSLNDYTRYGKSDLRIASWVGLLALTFYLFGISVITNKIKSIQKNSLYTILSRYESKRLILLYVIVSLLSALLNSSIIHVPGGQLLLAITYLKWVLLTFLIIHTIAVDNNRTLVILLVLVEVLLSFSGFWAAFKDYILVAIGAYLIFSPRLSLKTYFILSIVFSVSLFFAVVWTYSKGEYRKYLTGGERTQFIIEQDNLSNIQKFYEIVQRDFSSQNFKENFLIGFENLVYRVSYVEFLALTMKQVPTYLPHENGNLLVSALEHILKPRILFPDKKPIYDSELTSKYTGVQFAGAEQGTSFSLGTVAESYVDFGKYYMFIPIFFFGLWIGWMYKYFIVNGYNIIWGMCYSAPIFQFAWSFPVPTAKFFGWSVTYFIGFWFLNKYIIKHLDNWLLKEA
jgi:hypothetical protein